MFECRIAECDKRVPNQSRMGTPFRTCAGSFILPPSPLFNITLLKTSTMITLLLLTTSLFASPRLHLPRNWSAPSLLYRTTRRGTTTQSQNEDQALFFERDISREVQELYRFLEEQECEGTESLAIGWTLRTDDNDDRLRGLFSTEDFQTGEFLFAIPLPATLLVQEIIIHGDDNDDNDSIGNGEECSDEEMKQAVAFLDLFLTNPTWEPCINCLPRVDQASFDGTPDFWTPQALKRFPVPLLRQRSRERYRRVQRESSKKREYPTKQLQWALWIIRSRGFTSLKQLVGGKIRERTMLLPLIDMINHDGENPNACIEVIETDSYDTSFIALQAHRPIARGEQITLRYGTGFENSLELLDKYGFFTRDNPNDERIDWDLVDMEMLEDKSGEVATELESISQICEHLRRQRPN